VAEIVPAVMQTQLIDPPFPLTFNIQSTTNGVLDGSQTSKMFSNLEGSLPKVRDSQAAMMGILARAGCKAIAFTKTIIGKSPLSALGR